jgi:multidrug efflux pump
MTTGAMVLGALPLAIATGAGAESRNQIGWVIIGGMMVGTLFTLFVIPTIYAMVKTRGRNFWNEQKFLDHFEDFKD